MAQPRQLLIEWGHLDHGGQTCVRSALTGETLASVIAQLVKDRPALCRVWIRSKVG